MEPHPADALTWLLEPDPQQPAIRYYALRDLLCCDPDDPALEQTRMAIMAGGPVPVILQAQHPEGYWYRAGGGYKKYQGTAWQIILLGELGADPADPRVQRGCEYLLSHTLAANGGFAYNSAPIPSGVVHCLNGNLVQALIRLGRHDDPRVQQALDWQARAITGEEPIRFYQSGTSSANFGCAANGGQPCAWGATKALKALSAVPPARRSPLITRAIERGVQFLLAYNLASADYPSSGRVSSAWFKLGFPLSYWSDILETLAVLAELGHGRDARLADAYDWLIGKQDAHGRWKLEQSLNGKMWIDIEQVGKPSKWITLRMLRLIGAVKRESDGAIERESDRAIER